MATRVERVNIITEFVSKGNERYRKETEGAGRATDALDKRIKQSSKSAGIFGGIAAKAGALLVAAFTVTAVVKFGRSIAQAAKEVEHAEKSIQVFTGSLQSAKKLIQDIEDLAIRTPFEDEELIAAGRDLAKFGVETQKIVPILEDVAEVAVATGASIGGIAPILGRIQSQGKATFRELSGIVASGIPIYNLLADSLGLSISQVKKLGQEGKISASDITTAFEKATAEGGKYNGVLEAQRNTIGGIGRQIRGLLSNGITQNLGRLFQPLIKEGLRAVLALLGDPSDPKSIIGRFEALANSDAPITLAANVAQSFSYIKAAFNTVVQGIQIGFNGIVIGIENVRKNVGQILLLSGQVAGNQSLITKGAEQVAIANKNIAVANEIIAISIGQIKDGFNEADGKFTEVFERLKKERDDFASKPIVDQILNDDIDGELQAAIGSLAQLQEALTKAQEIADKTAPTNNLFTTYQKDVQELEKQIEDLLAVIEKIRSPREVLNVPRLESPGELGSIVPDPQSEEEAVDALNLRLTKRVINARKELATKILFNDKLSDKQREKAYQDFEDKILDIQIQAALERLAVAKLFRNEFEQAEAEADLLQLQLEKGAKPLESSLTKFQEGAGKVADFIGSTVLPIIDGIRQVTDALEANAQRAVEIQERRVADAAKLAEKGNAELLQLEEDRLRQSEEKQRRAAQVTKELAAIQFAANSAIAISRVAAETGILSPAGIAVLIATLAGGIAQARALAQGFAEGTEFVPGPSGHDKVAARLTRGERVVDKDTNKAMAGFPNDKLPDAVKMYYAFQNMPVARDEYFQRQDATNDRIEKQLAQLNQSVNNMRLYLSVDEYGIHTAYQGADRKIKKRDSLFYEA